MNARTWISRGSRLASVDADLGTSTFSHALGAARRRWPDLPMHALLLAGAEQLDDAQALSRNALRVDGLPDGWAICWPQAERQAA